MLHPLRFYVSNGTQGFVKSGAAKAGVSYSVYDRARCHREMGRFRSEDRAYQHPSIPVLAHKHFRSIGEGGAKGLAVALARTLNAQQMVAS